MCGKLGRVFLDFGALRFVQEATFETQAVVLAMICQDGASNTKSFFFRFPGGVTRVEEKLDMMRMIWVTPMLCVPPWNDSAGR